MIFVFSGRGYSRPFFFTLFTFFNTKYMYNPNKSITFALLEQTSKVITNNKK